MSRSKVGRGKGVLPPGGDTPPPEAAAGKDEGPPKHSGRTPFAGDEIVWQPGARVRPVPIRSRKQLEQAIGQRLLLCEKELQVLATAIETKLLEHGADSQTLIQQRRDRYTRGFGDLQFSFKADSGQWKTLQTWTREYLRVSEQADVLRVTRGRTVESEGLFSRHTVASSYFPNEAVELLPYGRLFLDRRYAGNPSLKMICANLDQTAALEIEFNHCESTGAVKVDAFPGQKAAKVAAASLKRLTSLYSGVQRIWLAEPPERHSAAVGLVAWPKVLELLDSPAWAELSTGPLPPEKKAMLETLKYW